jgi:hypothetical protein
MSDKPTWGTTRTWRIGLWGIVGLLSICVIVAFIIVILPYIKSKASFNGETVGTYGDPKRVKKIVEGLK